jgi:hypothetical protein
MYSAIRTIILAIPLLATPLSGQPAKTPAAPETAPASPQLAQTCHKLYDKFAIPLQNLWAKRGPDLKAEMTDGFNFIEDLPKTGCDDAEVRKQIIELLAKILNTHSGKIGVIMPISAQGYLKHFTTTFDAYLRASNLDPQKILVLEDTQGKPEKVHAAVASMVYRHRVSALIGGTEPAEAAILAEWGHKLAIPTFLMIEPTQSAPKPFVYYAHPTQAALAKAAAESNIRYGHRRVAILSPLDQHSDRFISEYERIAKGLQIDVSQRFFYDSKRFDSMESAARKIFRLDPSDRKEELKNLYEAAKKRAKESGTTFNPKMVALQPDIRFDAILIPDTFKIVRHFAKIMTFLGARRVPLFGHFEWRSPGLISPWDNFLSGSYFVDFQGSYLDLPDPIKIQTQGSPYFVPGNKVEQADFSLVAWRAMEVPLALARKTTEPRRKLDKLIPGKTSATSEVAFDGNHVLIWYPSTFAVSAMGTNSGQINLLGRVTETPSAP